MIWLKSIGPLMLGIGLNVTVHSYCGSIDFGFLSCPRQVSSPQRIADRIPTALDELEAALAADPR